MSTSSELAVTEQAARGKPVSLTGRQDDFDGAYRLAKNLAMSSIIPQDLRGNPADVLVIVLYGQELGLAPMQAMNTIDVVKGRPSLRANLWVALTRKAGHKVRVLKETGTSCTVSVTRNDDPEPVVVTYTLDDAKTAGLLSNDNYRKNPKAMLYARAASTACRRACPEVAMGFVDEYEAEVIEAPPQRPTLAQIAAERTDQRPVEQQVVPSADAEEAMLREVAEIAREHAAPEPIEAEFADEDGGMFAAPEAPLSGGERL